MLTYDHIRRRVLFVDNGVWIEGSPPGPIDSAVVFAHSLKQTPEQRLDFSIWFGGQTDTGRDEKHRWRDLIAPARLAAVGAVTPEWIVLAAAKGEVAYGVVGRNGVVRKAMRILWHA